MGRRNRSCGSERDRASPGLVCWSRCPVVRKPAASPPRRSARPVAGRARRPAATCRSPSGRRLQGLWSVISSEVPRQLLPLDEQARGAPVGTGDRLFGRLEVGEQAALLGDVEDVAELHRRVAGEGCGGSRDRPVAAVLGQRGQRLLDRGGCTTGGQLDRDRDDAQAARPELLELQPKARELVAVVGGGGYQRG